MRFPSWFWGLVLLLGVTAELRAQFEIVGGVTNLLDPRRAGASAEVSGGAVSSIDVQAPGNGYSSPPLVTIAAPPSGTTAQATAVVSGGEVISVNVTPGQGGSGYTESPAVFIAPPPDVALAGTTTPQFAGQANTSATVGAISTAGVTAGRFPQAQDVSVPASPVTTVVMKFTSFGHSFASGVPLYFLGDEIERPSVRFDGVPLVGADYWRTRPLAPGETFAEAYVGNLNGATQPLVAQATVDVISSTATGDNSQEVTVASVPPTLTPGATLLGQRVNLITGNVITLAGSANQTISSSTPVTFDPYQPYYYSPHANRVFASQSGRVTITWVSAAPDTLHPGEVTPTYKFLTQTFAVSSASRSDARTIYWTERGFDGPLVQIPGSITRVNPIYNTFVPGMTEEFVPVGDNPNPDINAPGETRTLWFDNQNGPASVHAYNVEGRIFVEYLGVENQGVSGIHEFLGADIVDIKRVAEIETIDIKLGERLTPRSGPVQDGDDQLVPSLLFDAGATGKQPYGTFIRANGITDYYAERENLDPDRVTLYWLEANDAGIHFLQAPSAPGLSIDWPKFKRNYRHLWPTLLTDFEPVNVYASGNSVASALQFEATSLPQVIFQDDPNELEVEVDGTSQRLLVDFSASADNTSRSLLKFSSAEAPWYVRLYIQEQGRVEVNLDPAGDGLEGSPGDGPDVPIEDVVTLSDRDADGVLDYALTTDVGTRLAPPSLAPPLGPLEPGGFIASGRCYSASAYIDPLVQGVDAAASGGIIPVNALPADDELEVWWFKRVHPPSDKYAAFDVPALAVKYTVQWPSSPQELVIASTLGVENPGLTSEQASGSIYVQNDPDPNGIGYNPNEEHALMLQGNVYALRDDLNTAASSEPFVLIEYTETGTEGAPDRPAMRVVKVIRSNATYPLTYDKIAGTPLQPPAPLVALPLPLDAQDQVANKEVELAPDAAAGPNAPDSYDSFTFPDRKGQHWIYRGPHDGGSPSFGMQFFYYLREGFYDPSLSATQQPAVGSIQPFIADTGPGSSVTLTYLPKWPDDPTLPPGQQTVLGELQTAETLTLPKAGLPQIRGQSSVSLIYQQSIANTGLVNPAVVLHDSTRQKTADLASSDLDELPPSVLTTDYAGRTYFQGLPPDLQNRCFYNPNLGTAGSLVVEGQFVDEIAGDDYLFLNKLSASDVAALKALCTDTGSVKTGWDGAVDTLVTTLETFVEITTAPGTFEIDPAQNIPYGVNDRVDVTNDDQAVDSYALSSTGKGTGYVTLVFNNGKAFTDPADPVSVSILKVSPDLYPGELKIVAASNPLDEQVVLRHSGDYGGHPEEFEFQWRYGFPDGGNPPAGDPASSPNWLTPSGTLGSSVRVGGSPSAAISTPAVLMGDTYFTMRYRKTGGAWADWTSPALVEGWIKRVLAKINPFNQRMDDLFNSSVNSDVSLITQAGTRWEGDIALNLENVNEAGLIEIYETVLNRGRSFTINSGIDLAASNDAMILAAGYLSDLYAILGNEAFADAANPTISLDDDESATEVNTSRFSFEGQVATSLDEELALLKGRDDFNQPGVDIRPAYNRLYWNYTRGIDSGEVLYAVNYNIQETAGAPTENGILDAADAQYLYPQGHGDAYGHYLTSIKGYYKLLTHPFFTWTPRAEAVNVLGQPVSVDYQDERKFAAAAVNIARTAEQVIGLVQRQSYNDDPAQGWNHFRDGTVNGVSNPTPAQVLDEGRHQGLDEWISRSTQGAFYHWVVGNAQLPSEDSVNTGIAKVDRTTVPELNLLTSYGERFQADVDLANEHLNPLGLSPDAIAFDISPAEHAAGHSHYDQVSERALSTLLNAKGAFDQAARMTRLLRGLENDVAEQRQLVVDQESAFTSRLLEIYGSPYAGDIGPGLTYEQGYDGPDFFRWFIVDRPQGLIDTTAPITLPLDLPTGFNDVSLMDLAGELDLGGSLPTVDAFASAFGTGSFTSFGTEQITVQPNQYAQFSDVIGGALGTRTQTGQLQQALLDAHLARLAFAEANEQFQTLQRQFRSEGEVLSAMVEAHSENLTEQGNAAVTIGAIEAASAVLDGIGENLAAAASLSIALGNAAAEFFPSAIGFSNDVGSPARGAVKLVGVAGGAAISAQGVVARASAGILAGAVTGLEIELNRTLTEIGFDQDELQAAAEYQMLANELSDSGLRFDALLLAIQRADQEVSNLLAEASSIELERESFRQRAAGVIAGFRTNDFAFRAFRNEALEQYRTLFDLAGRYTFLAAKSYDYETGLLGSSEGRAVINRIVASRALGDLAGGVPQATTSTLGDAGLAGTLAQMNADFTVAEGRLGINNPDTNGTLFSLRHELFRLLKDPSMTSDDSAWQQTLEQFIVANLLADEDVATHCNGLGKPDDSPVPGILIPFTSTIQQGKNFFGLDLAVGDHNYSPSNFSTKISSVGLVLEGYVGMDPYAQGTPNAGGPALLDPDGLAATPYVYLIPVGQDFMRAPPLGDAPPIRSWRVADQALPLPYNLGASDFNETQFFTANGTLTEQPWILRQHPAFRPVSDPAFFYSSVPNEFTNSRLIGRSAWNGQWKLVIPAYTLLNDEQEGLDRFVRSVSDIQLFLRTYSHSGN